MRLLRASLGNKGNLIETAHGKRYQVRWWLDPGSGRMPIERKLTTFRTKGECAVFIGWLRMANFQAEDWKFDDDGQPVQGDTQSTTFMTEIDEYVTSRWKIEWQSSQRNKARGRFLELAALTLTRPSDRLALRAGLDHQRLDRGRPKDPTTEIEWAARYLRVHAFNPLRANDVLPDQVDAGRRWLEAASLPVSALDDRLATRVRLHFCEGVPFKTARTYWGGVMVPFFSWLDNTGKVTGKPLLGQPKVPRDIKGERPDKRLIPDPAQLARIATEFGICHGEKWELRVLLAGFEALRLGESLAVTGDQFSWVKGQWRYNASVQEYRAVAAYSDDGKTTKVSTKTKSTRSNTPPPRNAPVPRHLGMRLEKCFGERLGTSTEHLFVGPRGGIANHETVREWWNAIVRRLYGDHPTLSAMTPHVLRHAGMTFWFAAPNAEQKLIQQWGGWQSLKEMLDTYRGVIDALEVEATSSIDEFHQRWLPEPDSDPLEVLSPNARSGNVYDLNARRMRRPDATGSTGS